MRWDKSNVQIGMFVTSTRGERLGKVIRCDPETFVVEKGMFFPKDYELRYDHISDLAGDSITYSLTDFETRYKSAAESSPAIGGTTAKSATATAAATTATAAAKKTAAAASGDEMRIQLMDEEIGIEKIERETGHVRIHKNVKTEEKRFTVPVTREEVVIERVASSRQASADTAFQDQTLDLPLHEEEIRVTKRPVVREEVVVRKVVQAVERQASASLRHEEAEIEDTRRSSHSSSESYSQPGISSPGGYSSPGSKG